MANPVDLGDTAIADLRKTFDGEIVRKSDAEYEAARRVWNGMVDKHPSLVVRPRGTADVVAAVRFARSHELEIAVRCGGHGTSGQSVSDGGVVIDLGLMRAVMVDPTARRARVQGGALLADLDREAQHHGLVTTGGVISHTGVGGLTLGGGYGYLARRFGLACDNVLSAEVVTADGDVVTASPDSHPDLYWGIRGGGGNFGIVTTFEFRLHPFGPDILSVDLAFGEDDGPAALAGRSWNSRPEAPDHMSADAAVVTARRLADPARGGPRPDRRVGRPTPTRTIPRGGQAVPATPPGRRQADRRVRRGHALPRAPARRRRGPAPRPAPVRQVALRPRRPSDALIEALLAQRGGQRTRRGGQREPRPARRGGRSRVGPDETAFSGRDAIFDLVVTSSWEDPALDADRLAAARAFGDAVAPLSSGKSYVNAIDGSGIDKVRAAFGAANYDRLVAVGDHYDPENVFHLNQNVRPSGS